MRVVTLLLASAAASPAHAQNVRVWSSFNSGFVKAQDNQRIVRANTGQPFVGSAAGGNNGLQAGFLAPLVLQYAQTTVSVTVLTGWNMMSVPLTVSNYGKSALYPIAVSNAFSYEGIYVVKSSLLNGQGYWLKFGTSQTVAMTGYLRIRDTVTVRQGWNMIGSISSPINTSSITSSPGGMTTSQFFAYSGTYYTTTTIEPGNACWVKVNQNGKLILTSSSMGPASASIKIVPILERPPAMPGEEESTLPKEFALDGNYPNPFNPTTTVRYELPKDARVSIRIYDILGREVETLVDEVQGAGFKSVVWSASAVASGVYMVRLEAKPVDLSPSYVSTRKMMMLK